jgi:hypothetical protein
MTHADPSSEPYPAAVDVRVVFGLRLPLDS